MNVGQITCPEKVVVDHDSPGKLLLEFHVVEAEKLDNYPEQAIVDQESPGETVNLVVKDMMERDSNDSGDLEYVIHIIKLHLNRGEDSWFPWNSFLAIIIFFFVHFFQLTHQISKTKTAFFMKLSHKMEHVVN